MTLKQQILAHLRRGGTLTPLEALSRFGCLSLSQRCGELRADGHKIDKYMRRTASGKLVACYYMVRA